VAFFIWLLLVFVAHSASIKFLPDRDPYLFPAAALLSGWGLLTIWRLDQVFGIKQVIWFSISMIILIAAMRTPHSLVFLRRYKYLLLLSGLILTALTIISGINPLGIGPRLWLGCCGFYFQPSEPLKLLLVVYLAAYLADRHPVRFSPFPLLTPTIVLTGIALSLLLVQRDLGTASIFIFIFTVILFIVTGKKRVLLGSAILLISALLVGYSFINIIHTRVNGWINPWNDPSGHSYQIVQSLLAIANGGTIGRGPGLGSPSLVPVAISDFIFAAIAEETGLAGIIGLLAIIWLILARGIIVSLRAADRFRRFLAAGVVTYLGVQSLLIIGGNLRLLPLTGVTLPFVSYGGSSLLTSFVAIAILLVISTPEDNEPAALPDSKPYTLLAALFGFSLAIAAFAAFWWIDVRGPDLLNRTDNTRRAIADRYVLRGEILDRNNLPINVTEGASGSYFRVYLYPDLAPVTGYIHPVFGQAGIESSVDPYLRGLQGNPASLIWWDHLLYGTPPPGLNVRLSIDLNLQTKADLLLGNHAGSLILINAKTGEILVMASHPTYDPNKLDTQGTDLLQDSTARLVNRATQGLYPVGTTLLPIARVLLDKSEPNREDLIAFYKKIGLYQAPQIILPVAYDATNTNNIDDLRVSPLQMALAVSVLGSNGVIPGPRIAMAVNTNEHGWVVLPAESRPVEAFQAEGANEAALSLIVKGKPYWQDMNEAKIKDKRVTWLLSGTLPDWGGTPLTLVVALEEDNISLAQYISKEMLRAALGQ
jgi:cell division protein FtsW (lipid II flippase)